MDNKVDGWMVCWWTDGYIVWRCRLMDGWMDEFIMKKKSSKVQIYTDLELF